MKKTRSKYDYKLVKKRNREKTVKHVNSQKVNKIDKFLDFFFFSLLKKREKAIPGIQEERTLTIFRNIKYIIRKYNKYVNNLTIDKVDKFLERLNLQNSYDIKYKI